MEYLSLTPYSPDLNPIEPVWKKLYDVTIASVTGGEVTTDKAQAIADETVTLTIAPADGYALGYLNVVDRFYSAVAVDISGNTATFTMPLPSTSPEREVPLEKSNSAVAVSELS